MGESCNQYESPYGRSSVKSVHFVPIRLQTWPPQTILVSDWLISKKSKFRFIWPNGFRGDFFKSANQKQELPIAMAAMFVNRSELNEQSL
jgi:hypothetical protein